ncbi:hypothetical protein SELMODRAFT_442773 [Selaginella moellendorffii]|uniref:Uncharacterized protein n=1 Tax=Selaginella moellendorffii TaxID=88036 RepID=D8RVZ5_SELML|nr:hypothetical protein SELMODRAFT_442773 [Selaginella moellendorffii]
MDTTSRVGKFLGHEWWDPSARSPNPVPGFFLLSPWIVFFKGDIGENSTLLPATSTQGNSFEEVVSNEWMLKYGRLLWCSLYLSNLAKDPAIDASESCHDLHRWLESATDADKVEAFQTVFGIRQYKLTLVTTRDINQYSEHVRIAMLGVRYGIFIDPLSKLVNKVDNFFSQLVKMPFSELAQQKKMPHQEKAKDMKRLSRLIALAKHSPQFSGLECLDESPYLSLYMNKVNKVDMVAPECVWKAFERELTAEQDQYEGKNLAQQKQIERELSLEWTVILENPLNLEEQYEGKNPAQQE